MKIEKNNKTKAELLDSLEKLKENLKDKISEYNIEMTKITDGYNVKAQKKFLMLNFWVDANIIAGEGYYDISWETNAPEGKVAEAMDMIKHELDKV